VAAAAPPPPLFVELRLHSASIRECDVGAGDPVERRTSQCGDQDLIGRGIELGPADRADSNPANRGYFFPWPWFVG
jgi:hypothetical protein